MARSIVLRASSSAADRLCCRSSFLRRLGLTIAVSFWQRVGLSGPARISFSISYLTFFDSVRFAVLTRSLLVSIEATVLSLFISYPIAYFLAFKTRPDATRLQALLLFTTPFLVNYVIRAFALTYLLGRTSARSTRF